MFEREPTAPTAGTVLFEPRDLRVTTSAGTIQQQFEQSFGKRSESELRTTWGDAMYDAYVAVNAGTGPTSNPPRRSSSGWGSGGCCRSFC